ncbi:uroporphyrinogen decarboxylase family protein [Staphylococcus aureus]
MDSSVGALNVKIYQRYIKPHMIRLISEVKEKHDVPVILSSRCQ